MYIWTLRPDYAAQRQVFLAYHKIVCYGMGEAIVRQGVSFGKAEKKLVALSPFSL